LTHRPSRSGDSLKTQLLDATRRFGVESPALSWRYVGSTIGILLVGTALVAQRLPWFIRLPVSVWNGLVVVRAFILYHDHLHGSLLGNSLAARYLIRWVGFVVMAPPNVWRETHNYHHAHTAKLVGSHIGSFPMMSIQQWERATPAERRRYRFARHPLTVALGYFTIFMFEMSLASFLRGPRKNWDSLAALLLNWGLTAILVSGFGPVVWFYCHFLPLVVACMLGGYLFYAQHNYPDARIQAREQWSFERAALESSSYMELGPLMNWVTANIGYHNVHHLNPSIPFYRLPEAMKSIPELSRVGKTTLRPRDVAACFRLKLWDPQRGKMVGFPS